MGPWRVRIWSAKHGKAEKVHPEICPPTIFVEVISVLTIIFLVSQDIAKKKGFLDFEPKSFDLVKPVCIAFV